MARAAAAQCLPVEPVRDVHRLQHANQPLHKQHQRFKPAASAKFLPICTAQLSPNACEHSFPCLCRHPARPFLPRWQREDRQKTEGAGGCRTSWRSWQVPLGPHFCCCFHTTSGCRP